MSQSERAWKFEHVRCVVARRDALLLALATSLAPICLADTPAEHEAKQAQRALEQGSRPQEFEHFNGQPGITATLVPDRADYLVAEPLRVQLRVRNDTSRAVSGVFALQMGHRTQIMIRRIGGTFSPIHLIAEGDSQRRSRIGGGIVHPTILTPSSELGDSITLAWDGERGAPVLSEAGEFELKAITNASPASATRHLLETDPVRIRVASPPASESAAVAAYVTQRIGALAQGASRAALEGDMADLRTAHKFVKDHPASAYAEYVRASLLGALHPLIVQGQATEEQRLMHASLKGEGDPSGDPEWSPNGVWYGVGNQASFEGATWKCIQAHRSQSDWAPPRVPALWVKVVQTNDWTYPVEYAVGAEVTFQGARYRCVQAHTSQVGWTPPSTPALWTKLP